MGDGGPAYQEDDVYKDDLDPTEDPEYESAIRRGSATFQQWADAWFYSQRKFNPSEPIRRRYARYRDLIYEPFEAAHGVCLGSYYCVNIPSAASLTEKQITSSRFGRSRSWLDDELHIVTSGADAVGNDVDGVSALELLNDCDEISTKIAEYVSMRERPILLDSVFGVVTDGLAIVDAAAGKASESGGQNEAQTRDKGVATEPGKIVLQARERLKEIQAAFERAALRASHSAYLRGMTWGLVIVAAACVVVWALFRAAGLPDRPLVLACLIAGSFGAVFSVLSRMTLGKLVISHEPGPPTLRNVGMMRPFVGAVLGLFMYFGVISGLIPLSVPETSAGRFALFVVAAFLTGSAERLAQDTLTSARSRLNIGDKLTRQP